METTAVATEKMRELEKDTAGFLRRWVASMVDALIFSPLLVLATVGLERNELSPYLIWPPLTVILLAYGILLLGRYGKTVGMMALKIRVTNLEGGKISYSKAALRTVVFWLPYSWRSIFPEAEAISWALSSLCAIGLLWIIVDRAHQGYHDKIANTLVMRESGQFEQDIHSCADLADTS